MRAILIAILFLTNNLFGQETKKVTVMTTTPAYSKEVYYVLKDDKKIRHGEYLRYGWTKDIGEKGVYDMNKRVGTWEFYDFKGELDQKYNYTDKKMEFLKPSELIFHILTEINGTYEDRLPDEMPIFIGGESRLSYYMLNMKYPVDARRQGVAGKVLISAIINKDGQMIDEKVVVGIGYGCDEEALKTIKNIPDEWIPAKIKGENTNVRISIPVTFKLD